MNTNFNSLQAPEPVGSYPHAKKIGDFLFLSGVGPRKRGSKIIPGVNLSEDGEILSYDIKKQCISVFENIIISMGNYFFTNYENEKIKVEYSFGYVLDEKDNELKIIYHHSSVPYNID